MLHYILVCLWNTDRIVSMSVVGDMMCQKLVNMNSCLFRNSISLVQNIIEKSQGILSVSKYP